MKKTNEQKNKQGKLKSILKIICIILLGIIIIPTVILFIVRGVNSIRFRLKDGVQEKIYIQLSSAEQFINIRGRNIENPVVIWLHGGPGGPDTFFTTTFQQELESDFTFIRWDQRGCGRTYYKSRDLSLSWDAFLADLDELVDYAASRFNQPIILVGHSWGSALGSTYAAEHPEKIAGYVGIGQFTDDHESEKLAAEKSEEMARTAGNDIEAEKIKELYQSYTSTGLTSENADLKGFLQFRQLTASYLSPNDKDPILTALVSPDFGWNDLRWNLRILTNMEGFLASNRELFTDLEDFELPYSFEVPVILIQGENDYVCSTVLAEKYQQSLSAPISEIFIMKELGHGPMFDDPDAFADVLKKAFDLIVEKGAVKE